MDLVNSEIDRGYVEGPKIPLLSLERFRRGDYFPRISIIQPLGKLTNKRDVLCYGPKVSR